MTKEQARELGKAIVSYVFESHVLQNNGSGGMVWARNDKDFITKLSDILADDPKPECPAKRMEYWLEGACDRVNLTRTVENMLNKGWVCQGGVAVSAAGVFYQALVREVAG